MGKISACGFIITRLYSVTVPTDGKKRVKCKVNRPVRLHVLSVTLHSSASCEDEFFSEHFM